jgi:hypothetical protein
MVPLAIAATAYACTSVATLSESPASALPGSTVTVNGAYFGIHDPANATTAGPVEIRLGSLSGPVLATANPSGTSRTFSVQVTIPANATAGATFVTATQATASGTPVYGTPARQFFNVTAPAVATPPLFQPVVFTPPCVVPAVAGMRALAAEKSIVAAHCAVGAITMANTKPHSTRHHTYRLVVTATGLTAGTTAETGTLVDVTLRWK